MNGLAIFRAQKFSPNSIERDRAIMNLACRKTGISCAIREEDIEKYVKEINSADIILSMARGEVALHLLTGAERNGVKVVNSAAAVYKNSRFVIEQKMRSNKIPSAPLSCTENSGWWIKRGDRAATEKGDVRFAANNEERDTIVRDFKARGINDIVVTVHVEGDLVKFYGVNNTDFFHITYPTDNEFSKFGDERRNGIAKHTPFNIEELHRNATRLAKLTGIEVYGGDCIIRNDGTYAIIDFNDWPSFAVCREEAAEAIAQLIMNK